MSDLTLVIGNKNYSSWSLRPWMLLKHLGVEFTEQQLLLDTPTFKEDVAKFGPSGRVPVLKHGDITVWDSLSICEYIAELTGQGHSEIRIDEPVVPGKTCGFFFQECPGSSLDVGFQDLPGIGQPAERALVDVANPLLGVGAFGPHAVFGD